MSVVIIKAAAVAIVRESMSFIGGMTACSSHAIHNIVDLPPMLWCQGALSHGDFPKEIGDAVFVSQVGDNGPLLFTHGGMGSL